MAAKKRRTSKVPVSKAKARSAAARKGWETRKAKAVEAEKRAKARSAAARKGWETRKAKAAVKKPAKRKAVTPKKKTVRAKIESKPVVRKRREPLREQRVSEVAKKRLAELEERNRQLELELQGKNELLKDALSFTKDGLVYDAPSPAHLKKDGTIGLYPSRLRMLPEAEKLVRRMQRARRKREKLLADEAHRISVEYDVPVQEVYTLFFSS
jgi:hypothetical protein